MHRKKAAHLSGLFILLPGYQLMSFYLFPRSQAEHQMEPEFCFYFQKVLLFQKWLNLHGMISCLNTKRI
jgi:hypothetical protein